MGTRSITVFAEHNKAKDVVRPVYAFYRGSDSFLDTHCLEMARIFRNPELLKKPMEFIGDYTRAMLAMSHPNTAFGEEFVKSATEYLTVHDMYIVRPAASDVLGGYHYIVYKGDGCLRIRAYYGKYFIGDARNYFWEDAITSKRIKEPTAYEEAELRELYLTIEEGEVYERQAV